MCVIVDAPNFRSRKGKHGNCSHSPGPHDNCGPSRVVAVTRLSLVLAGFVFAAACSGSLGSSSAEPSPTESTAPVTGNTQADQTDSDGTDLGGTDSDGSSDLPGEQDRPRGESAELSEEEILDQLGLLQGQLAIGNGPQVAVARPDGLTLTELDGSETVLAAQPTWARDGRSLAWSSVSSDRQVVVVQPFDEEGLPTEAKTQSNAAGPAIYYLQWNHDNTRLAYLRSGRRSGQTELGTFNPGQAIEPIIDGVPLFMSWAPSNSELSANINRNSLALVDSSAQAPAPQEVIRLDGQFNAPSWVDDSTVLAVVDGWFVEVDVTDQSVERILDVGGGARFVLSPDRSKFAFQSLEAISGGITQASYPAKLQNGNDESREAPVGLIVVDLATSEQEVITPELALSWEWSPDSEKVAWLSAERVSTQPVVKWHFWSAAPAGVANSSTPSMRLPRKLTLGYLPFFDQYAQSVTRWGPDSTAFAFEGIIEGRSGIWMQLMGQSSSSGSVEPQLVAPGDFVTWGYGPTPEPVPSGGASPT